MATNRPRKNLFLDDELNEMLRNHAYKERISESEAGRRALSLYLTLAPTDAYTKALRFAETKGVSVTTVIEQCLLRQLEKYV